jgi:hypothetical protein
VVARRHRAFVRALLPLRLLLSGLIGRLRGYPETRFWFFELLLRWRGQWTAWPKLKEQNK